MRSRLHKLIWMLSALSLLAGCAEEPFMGEDAASSPGTDLATFWYSRTRSANENSVMMRHHALGFSYQAMTGKKCNVSDVMCQVFNIDYLTNKRACYNYTGVEVSSESSVERGIADYIHGTKWVSELSVDLAVYQKDKVKSYMLAERANDTTLVMKNSVKMRRGGSVIDVNVLYDEDSPGVLDDFYEYDELFSDNFRYAVAKLQANREDVAVIDSFLNIFGTHVVTSVEFGGRCDISVKTSKRHVQTYIKEKEISRSAVNLFFKTKVNLDSLVKKTDIKNIFQSAEIELSISGGDVSKFDALIANPSYDNALASAENFKAWSTSVAEAGSSWEDGMELIDMGVEPIYKFMPDEDLARRVKVRMEASAKDMRDQYGDLNFTSAEIPFTPAEWTYLYTDFYALCDPDEIYDVTLYNGYGFLHTILDSSNMPSRIVAATYYEDIPDLGGYVHVTYPVYENRIQLTEGIAKANGCFYSVKWLYDRTVVEKLEGSRNDTDKLYLYKGRLFTQSPIDGEQWRTTKTMPDYEWAGSLDTNGNLVGGIKTYYQVTKENDDFYLIMPTYWPKRPQSGMINNLPGWSYDSEKGRMVRDKNYRYKIIPKELRSR